MDPADSTVERSSTSVSANDRGRVGNSSTLESDEGSNSALHAAEDVLIPTTRAPTKRKTNGGKSQAPKKKATNKPKAPLTTDVAEDSTEIDSTQGITLTVVIISSVY